MKWIITLIVLITSVVESIAQNNPIYLDYKKAEQRTLVGEDTRPIPQIEYVNAIDDGLIVKILGKAEKKFVVTNFNKEGEGENKSIAVRLNNGYLFLLSANAVLLMRGMDEDKDAIILYPIDLIKMFQIKHRKEGFSEEGF